MPLRRWLRGGRRPLRERVIDALAKSRAGDPQAGLEVIGERYAEAMAELDAPGNPADTGWLQLAMRVQYRAGRMAEAAHLAERALTRSEDAATWHLLARARVWLHDRAADAAFARAAVLDPEHYVRPHRVSKDHFVTLADTSLARIPEQFRDLLANTLIVVDDLPPIDAVREGEDPDLLGLYEGGTVLEHGLPERIVLYQRNHETICGDEAALRAEIEETLRHEVGHHFGMEEDELPY